MKLSTPRWWYSRDRRVMPVTRAMLTPASWIWAAVTAGAGAWGAAWAIGMFGVVGMPSPIVVPTVALAIRVAGRERM